MRSAHSTFSCSLAILHAFLYRTVSVRAVCLFPKIVSSLYPSLFTLHPNSIPPPSSPPSSALPNPSTHGSLPFSSEESPPWVPPHPGAPCPGMARHILSHCSSGNHGLFYFNDGVNPFGLCFSTYALHSFENLILYDCKPSFLLIKVVGVGLCLSIPALRKTELEELHVAQGALRNTDRR